MKFVCFQSREQHSLQLKRADRIHSNISNCIEQQHASDDNDDSVHLQSDRRCEDAAGQLLLGRPIVFLRSAHPSSSSPGEQVRVPPAQISKGLGPEVENAPTRASLHAAAGWSLQDRSVQGGDLWGKTLRCFYVFIIYNFLILIDGIVYCHSFTQFHSHQPPTGHH